MALVADTGACPFEAGSAGHTLWLIQLAGAERQRGLRMLQLRAAMCTDTDGDSVDV